MRNRRLTAENAERPQRRSQASRCGILYNQVTVRVLDGRIASARSAAAGLSLFLTAGRRGTVTEFSFRDEHFSGDRGGRSPEDVP